MIRVAYLFGTGEIIGGGELSLLSLMDEIRRCGVDPIGVVSDRGEVYARLEKLGIPVVVAANPAIRPWNFGRVCSAARELERVMVNQKVTLIHANGARCMLYAGYVARRLRIPCVWHVRVLSRDRWLDWWRAKGAVCIVANSKAVAATLSECASSTPVEVVYNGFRAKAIECAKPANLRELGVAESEPVVLSVARLSRWKGIEDLIDAHALLQAGGVVSWLVLAGNTMESDEDYEAELRARVVRLDLSRVVFAGWRDDVAGFMKAATVLALPSHGEAFGRVIVEAWMAGLPVVATNAGGPAEIVQSDVNGILVPMADPDALAGAIRKILHEPGVAGRLSAAGKVTAGGFSLEEHAKRMMEIYMRYVEKGGA